MSADVLLVLTERQCVNQLEKMIVGLSWEHIAATSLAHWFYSTEHAVDFDGFFWDDAQVDNDDW